MVRRIKQRRARRVEVPLMDADLWLRSGYDFFDRLEECGFEPSPRPGQIQDATLLLLWEDYRHELEAEWANPRSPFYRWPEEQGEPHIYQVLRRRA